MLSFMLHVEQSLQRDRRMLLNWCELLRYISIIVAAWGEQAGDPTGTGTTSESVYGKPFKDEFHSRLRFSHRCTKGAWPFTP